MDLTSMMLRAARNTIEVRLAVYGFVVNFIWEMLQGPLFTGMLVMPWWDATKLCLRAAVGDAAMIVIAFAAVALLLRDRAWLRRPRRRDLAWFALLAALPALALEWHSVRLGRWSYASAMPVLPVLDLGLAPVLQWLALPLLVSWMARRRPA